jgi:cbb3-type cytochrome oxidase subunit 3
MALTLFYNDPTRLGQGIKTMLFDGGFTFGNFIADAFTIFMFILWFWLLIVVSGDLFRRHDVSGFAKVLWVIAFVLFSYLGVFAYLLTQGRGMAERNRAQASEAREELRHIVGFSAADEIVKLDKLKIAGSITEQEYGRLRAKLVA